MGGTRKSYSTRVNQSKNKPDSSKEVKATVTTNSTNIRSGPGTACNIIGTADYGSELILSSEVSSKSWRRLADGSGWVHINSISLV